MQIARRRILQSAAAGGAVLLGAPHVARAQAAREFKIGLITGPSHNWTQAMQAFAEALKKESNGRLSAAVFPAGQLGNEPAMIQQMQAGGLDMGFLTLAEFSNRNANFGAFFAPYLARDVTHAARLLKGAEAAVVLEQVGDQGLAGLGFGLGGMRHLLSRAPVPNAAALKGRKFRITPFAPLRDFYNLAGIAPTPIPLPGMFDALANGQIDGADVDLELVWTLKLFQQAKHLVLTNHMMFPVVSVMSCRVFAGLPQADRQLVRRVMNAELDRLVAKYAQAEGEWLAQIRGTGIEVRQVGREFFGDVAAAWEKHWTPSSPSLARLRAEAA
jgi:TRAP-type transport system periplasmic protein